MSLSFDEFRAISRRNQADSDLAPSEEDEEDNEFDDEESNDDENKTRPGEFQDSSSKHKKIPFTLGDFLETQEIQGLTLFFLLVDTFSTQLQMSLIRNYPSIDSSTPNFISLCLRIIHSLTYFFIFYFSFEVLSLFIAFRFRLFWHLGYLTDIVVVGCQFWAVSTDFFSVECHILNIFRVWRFARLFQSMLSVELDAQSEVQLALTRANIKHEHLQNDFKKLDDDLKKEKEARSSVEEMLQEYKDEIDTLNEALKIAALDIAEVAQAEDDLFLSDEDDVEVEVDDMLSTKEHGSVVSSETDVSLKKLNKKEDIYNEALRDERSTRFQRSTIIINENGSYHQK